MTLGASVATQQVGTPIVWLTIGN